MVASTWQWPRRSPSHVHGRVPPVAPAIDLAPGDPYPSDHAHAARDSCGRTAMTATAGTTTSASIARLAPGFQLGDYRVSALLWPLRIADAYRAEGPQGAATLHVVHSRIAHHVGVRDHIIAGTRAAAALPEHRHRVRTLAAGLTGDILWIATEEVDGSLVRELMAKKRGAKAPGLGARATGNLITGVAAALADAQHGALATESVAVNRTGRVRV